MDTRTYSAKIEVLLKPVVNGRGPMVNLTVNGQRKSTELLEETWFEFTASGTDATRVLLEVEHYGKQDSDTNITTGADLAVIVEEVRINGIISPRFVWAGIYRPNYPKHLTDQPKELRYSNYLGWNGVWSLELTLPAFVWVHNLENLGWIYD